MKFDQLQVVKNMGLRYTLYRIKHELEKRLGVLERRHPMSENNKFFISLEDWRSKKKNYIKPENFQPYSTNKNEELKDHFKKIINGQVLFFSHEWKNLGVNYDWITNPESGHKYDNSLHWSKINDFSETAGDIKYVWEKSRFSWLLTVLRYDFHFQEDHAEFVFSEIESWINANPVNRGPNWRCSQEISLRLFNWYYALCYYKNSPSLTVERWEKIQNVIYWSLHHVYHHIEFSRIAVRNNHAITETLMLCLSDILFPFIPETKSWAKKGKKWFEEEIAYQIYADGTFLQFSMNYHRVVIQLLSLGISIMEWNKTPFSEVVYDRANKSLDFLYQCLQEENGYLPNYGPNDGALFFPFTNSEYRDYRPQLNTLYKVLTGKDIYPNDLQIIEDAFWMIPYNNSDYSVNKKVLEKRMGPSSFEDGGYYILRERDFFMFIRCGKHKDRPAHADNLHIDVWCKGINILRDSGTYKYNTERNLQEYFAGTEGHNTVMIGANSQMKKGSRFIWYYWTQAKKAGWKETDNEYIFIGEISAFRFLNPKILHKRVIKKKKNVDNWEVQDSIEGISNLTKMQLWHHDNYPIDISAFEESNILAKQNKESYYSDYYGTMEKGSATFFTFNSKITTYFSIKS